MSQVPESVRSLITTGSALLGASAAGALEFLAQDPAAAAAAGAAGVVIARAAEAVLADMASRHLSGREKARVGAASLIALVSIRKRLDAGDTLRDDGFLPSGSPLESGAAEILEGVLLRAKNEHQERKVVLLGRFYANLAFAPSVSAAQANYMLHLIETLTFRQLCFVALLERKGLIQAIPLSDAELADPGLRSHPELSAFLQEIYGVADLGLMFRTTDELRGQFQFERDRFITPVSMALSPLGERLVALLDLAQLPNEDINPCATLLHLSFP
jgi:hypothetical protein